MSQKYQYLALMMKVNDEGEIKMHDVTFNI